MQQIINQEISIREDLARNQSSLEEGSKESEELNLQLFNLRNRIDQQTQSKEFTENKIREQEAQYQSLVN